MTHPYSSTFSMDDDPFLPTPSPAVTSESHEVRLRDRPSSTATRQSSRQSGEWSTRLSTSGSSGSGRRDTALPPTRQGVLKPEDTLKVDAFRLVKPESSPLSIKALETLTVLEKQKQAQKETRTYKNSEDTDIDWEQNLSSWKDRRKSKSSYQSKALELGGEDDGDDSTGGKKSKTYKELMEQKEQRSNGHRTYTFENEDTPAVKTLPTAYSRHETPPSRTETKYGGDLPKQSEPAPARVPATKESTAEDTPAVKTLPTAYSRHETPPSRTETKYGGDLPKQSEPAPARVPATKESTAAESHSTTRYNFTEASDSKPRATSTRTSGYNSEVGHGTRTTTTHSIGIVPDRDSEAVTRSTSRNNFTEAPAKESDDESHPASTFTSEHLSEVGHGTKSSHLSDRSATERETDRLKPFELTVDLKVQSPKPAADPVDLHHKTTTTTESVRPLNTEPETSKPSWQAPSRQKSATYSAIKTTSAFEVQLREKPKGSQPLARPSSYAYTPSTRQPDSFIKPDIGRPPARVEVTRMHSGPGSNRDSVTLRQLDRAANPPGVLNTSKDRRVKSTIELNFEKTFSTDKSSRSDFRPPQKSVGGDGSSSSRFKQTLSLFQNKEAEGGGVGPVKALPSSLATQRSVGRISRLPGEDVKPSHSVVEMRRGSAAERRYQPDTSSGSYKTDAARLRGVSRSVQGLDTLRSEYGISDARNPVPKSDFLSRDRNDRYGSRDFGKAEKLNASSVETSSSRAHSSDEDGEKNSRNLSGKNSEDDTKPLETRESRGLSQYATDLSATRYSSLHDRPNSVYEKSTSVAGGSYSTSTKITDWDKKPESVKLNEPKELYAYKHRSPLTDESVIGSKDTGKLTTKYDEPMRRLDDKYLETKSSHIESPKTNPSARYDVKESYQPPKGATQQTSISDIFSKRSAAVIRGKSVVGETEPHFVPSVTPKVMETSSTGSTVKSPAEREMTRRLEAAVDETIKEFHDADSMTRTKDPRGITSDVTEAKIRHDQDEPSRKTDYDVTSVTRTTRDPYGSNRRLHGLERTEEPSSHRKVTQEEKSLDQQPAFEVNFSVSDVDKERRFGENKEDKSHVQSNAIEKERDGEKGIHQQPAFEVNFSVSELEKQRRFGDNKTGKSNAGDSFTVEKKKHGENAELIKINDYGVIKTTKEEERLKEDHDSFHRPTGSIGKQDVDAEIKHEKKTPVGDFESSKGHRNEFEIEIDTRSLFPEKRIPAVSLSAEPKTDKHGLGRHQELIIGFSESKVKESTKREPVNATTEDFYFGMVTGTSEEALHPIKTPGRPPAELVLEIPMPEGGKLSQGHRSPSPEEHKVQPHEHKLPSYEHKLPTEEHKLLSKEPIPEPKQPVKEHKLPSPEHRSLPEEHKSASHIHELPSLFEPKAPTDEHKTLSQEPKTERKQASKEDKLSSLEHRVSPLPPQEHKSRTEEHKVPSPDHTLPSYEHTFSTEVRKSSPLEHKASSVEQKWSSEKHTLPSDDYKSQEHKLPREEHKPSFKELETPSNKHKLPSEEDKLPSHDYKLQSPKEEDKSPPKEDKSPSDDEDKSTSLEHRLSPLPTPGHKVGSEEHKMPSEEHKLPSQERKSWSNEGKSSLLNRDAEVGPVIDLDTHPGKRQPTSSDKELDRLLDGTRFDVNSNIPTDRRKTPSPSPPRSTRILQDEIHRPSASDPPSHDSTTPKNAIVTTPVDKKRVANDESGGFLASSAIDGGGEPATEAADAKSNSAPKKKPPAPPPKTKPKPKTSNELEAQPAEKDDWGFLSTSQRLDVSVSKDKSRLLTTAPMGARRRPKSAMFPMLETTDPFSLGMTTDQNGPSKAEDDDSSSSRKLNGADSDPAPTSTAATPAEHPVAARLKGKGIRPVSYMEELNSSLFKKKKETATPSDDDEADSKPTSSTRSKMEDATEGSGELSKAAVRSSSSIRKRKEEEETARQLESTEAEKARSGTQVKIPGLMDELNISLKKKKQQESGQDSKEEEKNTERKPVSVEVATGDLLNFSDDVEGDAPPPPLPNAPPPLPNWSAFPGSTSSDSLLGLPPGLPPGPPPGPPPSDQPLLDLGSSDDDEPGPDQIHFRTTGLGVDKSHSQGDGNLGKAFQSSASDDMDFSFA